MTTVGPYDLYGEPLVAQCAASGTDYCDITGEFPFMCEMISRYNDLAFQSGARIVHFCGLDSLPWDIMTFMANRELKQRGDEMERVEHVNEILIDPSGGTLSSIMRILDRPPKNTALFRSLNQGVGTERNTLIQNSRVTSES